jgi:hypothetical protein
MTYTFKLARRLAVSRDFAMLAILAIVAACAGDSTTAPDSVESTPTKAATLIVSPRSVTAETRQPVRFLGRSRTERGQVVTTVAWSSTGGTISADGTFSSAIVGTFKVIGRGRGWKHADTAIVIVVPPANDVIRLTTSPTAATLNVGASRTFSATGYLNDGTTTTIGVNWTATGGDIDAAGTYTAGARAGTYRVVATNTAGTLADTSTVTIVTPTLSQVYLSPASVSLNAGATRQFSAYGRNSVGDSVPVTVAFSATGGTVTSGGLYTAGSTGGTFRVVAKDQSTGKADTSAVTIAAATPTLAQVYVTPASVSLTAGGSQQFKAYGRTSSGDSIPVTVAFSATSGTVTSGGLYTAGSTAGTFRVVAKESTSGTADTAAVTVSAPTTTIGTGIPFGPFALWNSTTTVAWGPVPFTGSIGNSDPAGLVTQLSAARQMGLHLVLFMTGGDHLNYLTNGAFDLSKWKARMDQFNTAAIKSAVAAGVKDGTIVGNSLMDEPEHKSWGGVMTKPLLDQMAAYAKAIFPTLPMGVNNGPTGYYQWRPTERYHVVDFVVNQYNWWVTTGDVAAWRDKVLAQAKLDGITPAFSLNILGGGVQDRDGVYDCTGAGQGGTFVAPNCRMTATQVRDWGRTLGVAGCVMLMWKYDGAFMAKTDNVQAFRDVAAQLAGTPSRSCSRS